jgi:hypothetical protein
MVTREVCVTVIIVLYSRFMDRLAGGLE